jgi:hypothetical protein
MQQSVWCAGFGATLVRALILVVLAGAAGVGPGVAWGQSAEPADPVCAADCTARGYEGEHCARVCELPDASGPPLPATDLRCARACRDRGGSAGDCVQRCPMR